MSMTIVTVTYSCCLCGEEYEAKVSLPPGWGLRYDATDEENAFCPRHAAVEDFANSQCPGCVGGWRDCSLWSSFQSNATRSISESDLATIRKGICPKRTNGTMMVRPGGLRNIDLRGPVKVAGGVAFAAAIEEYIKRYER